MFDREKVIKGLGEISDYFFSVYHHSQDKEEINKAKYMCDAVEDAIAMMKEQKKLIGDTPHWIFGNSYGHAWMKCSNCCVSQSGQTACWSYCPNCGAKMEGQVVWE